MLKKFKLTSFKNRDPLMVAANALIITPVLMFILFGGISLIVIHNKELSSSHASSYETTSGSVEAIQTNLSKEIVLSGVHYRLPIEFDNKLQLGDRIKIEYLKEDNTITSITTDEIR